MAVSFDFHTVSLTIDMPLDQYVEAADIDLGRGRAGILGLAMADVAIGDRSGFLRFRHEHAHFTSFVCTGLADLYGVISDYLLALLFRTMQRRAAAVRQVDPLLVRSAWDQVNLVRAHLFGFGTRVGVGALSDSDPHDAFWAEHYDPRLAPIIDRYYQLLARLRGGETPVDDGPALPRVSLDGRLKTLSARSVFEAYAINIEIAATYFVAMTSSLTTYSRSPVRNPGSLYTVALEYLLARLATGTTLDDYLAGKAERRIYYLVSSTTYAAMQLPVIQSPAGHVFLGVTPDRLSVGQRFAAIVDDLAEGRIDPPPESPKNIPDRRERILAWLHHCHTALGSSEAMDINHHVADTTAADPTFATRIQVDQSLIDLSWAARANFMREPIDYIYDAGLFAESFPCQPRYIRTGDGKLVMNAGAEQTQAVYLADHVVPVLEAGVFAHQWEVAWAKLPEIPPQGRHPFLHNAYAFAGHLLGYLDSGH